jgi:protein involved in polysaccharide export with SLBB domain
LKESGAPSKSDGTKASDSDENTDETSPPSSRLAVRPFARSDFELFAEDAAGHPLEVYGRRLFDEVPTTFAPMDRIPVPADYALGPGDQLRVRVWGKVELEFVTTIDRNGQISVPKVGSLAVAGLRYEELEGFLRKAIGNLYTGFEINVSLGRLRSIQIFVLGSARQPGAYTVSSLSTLVDALFASGGPSATGTMRRIQLRRSDHPTAELDVYDLLRKGDKSHDVQLLPGDVIYIPQVGPQVAIVANVNEPGIYELKGETTIASVLEAAGGLTNLAGMDRALLERVENRRRRRVDEFPLDALGLQRPLQDGDLLRIFGISPQFANAVTLRGNVAAPGRFMWHQGMRISDLIPSREFLVTAEHWSQQNHRGERRHNEMMNDIAVTDSEINWDYAAIERLDDRDLSTRLIPFNLAKAIDSPASVDNHELEVGDVVTVFSRKDLPLPIEKRATFVRIGGEVNAPGVYRVHPGETLRNVIARAGGLTSHSYLYASQLTRESTRRIQEEQLKLSIDRMRKDLESRVANGTGALGGSIASPQGASQIALNEQTQLNAQRALIDQLGGVRVTGRVVLGLKPDDRTLNDIPEFPLEDGDSFYIPPELGTVQVTGEVYNANAFRYEVKKRLALYLRNSGGPTRTADQKRIFVIRADGTVLSRQSQDHLWSGNFDRLILMPGDAVVVPPKLKNSSGFMTQLPILTQILSQTAMTGAVVSLIQ